MGEPKGKRAHLPRDENLVEALRLGRTDSDIHAHPPHANPGDAFHACLSEAFIDAGSQEGIGQALDDDGLASFGWDRVSGMLLRSRRPCN